MPLSCETRRVGDVTVVTCAGRFVAGPETAVFERCLDSLIPLSPYIVLHLAGVEFVDSGGLGLLVRYLTRVQNAHGTLAVCAVSRKFAEVLKTSRLNDVFRPYETEAEAIADVHRRSRGLDTSFVSPDVLCVDKSADVLAYLRELLKGAGYRAMTASNLPDALILLTATHPRVIVISDELRRSRDTRTAEEFHKLADARAVVELPSGFAGRDAADAAQHVLAAIGARLPGASPAT